MDTISVRPTGHHISVGRSLYLLVPFRSRAECAPPVSWRVFSEETQRFSDSHRIHFHRTRKTDGTNTWHQVWTQN